MRQNRRLLNYIRHCWQFSKQFHVVFKMTPKSWFSKKRQHSSYCLLHPNLSYTLPSVPWGSRTFVPIPTHSNSTSQHCYYYCRQQRWSTSCDKENNGKTRSFISQGTSKAWFPLGTCLAVGFLLCLLRWQLQLKLFLRGETQSHGFPDV